MLTVFDTLWSLFFNLHCFSTHRASHLLFLGFWRHLLWDEFDWSFDLPSRPLGAIRQCLHGNICFVTAGLVTLWALPEENEDNFYHSTVLTLFVLSQIFCLDSKQKLLFFRVCMLIYDNHILILIYILVTDWELKHGHESSFHLILFLKMVNSYISYKIWHNLPSMTMLYIQIWSKAGAQRNQNTFKM